MTKIVIILMIMMMIIIMLMIIIITIIITITMTITMTKTITIIIIIIIILIIIIIIIITIMMITLIMMIYFTEVTKNEILIGNCIGNSAGWVELRPSMIKMNNNCFKKPVAHICNPSFEVGIFPDELNLVNVVLIFKSCNDFFPISLMSQ